MDIILVVIGANILMAISGYFIVGYYMLYYNYWWLLYY